MKKYVLATALALVLGAALAACAPVASSSGAGTGETGADAPLSATENSLDAPAANAFGGKIPEFDQECLSCHGSYEKVAEATTHYGDSNPHDSVHGSYQSCATCHPGDKQIPEEHQCTECHAWPRTEDGHL